SVFEREARLSSDDARRALALYRLARIHDDRLDARAEAISSLQIAASVQPGSRLTLEALARTHAQARDFDALAGVLETLISLTEDGRERVALLHRLGGVLDRDLDRGDAAIERYRDALQIDPAFQPTIQAIDPLLSARGQWAPLVELRLAE